MVLLFEQYLKCTETAMGLAALTVEADGEEISRISSFGSVFVTMMVSITSRVRCHTSIRLSKTDSICVADLEILIDHPCDLCSREKEFFLCSFFLNEDSSFEVSVDDLLDTTRYSRIRNLKVGLQLCPSDSI